MSPVTVAAVSAMGALLALAVVFWSADFDRTRAVPGSLRRVQLATRVVLLSPGPLGYPLVWFVWVLATSSTAPLIMLPLMVRSTWRDARTTLAAWRESRFPGDLGRLKRKVRDALARTVALPSPA